MISFFYNFSGASDGLQDSTGVSVLPPGNRFAFPVEKKGTVDTGYAFAPHGVLEKFQISVQLFDADGELVETRVLEFEGHLAEFFSQRFGISGDFVGHIVLQADESLFLTVLRLESQAGGKFQLTSTPPQSRLQLLSPDLHPGGAVAARFACDGEDLSPALTWSAGPPGTESWTLIMEDPDAPGATWVHWIVFDIDPGIRMMLEGTVPVGAKLGRQDFGRNGWGGPCPPPGPAHRYFFKLYALDSKLDLPAGASREQVEQAMQGHILGLTHLMGYYQRP
ncbi:MAG: YbhB/YbcL family Raf kinase inhibitor-like protein [Acidobacteriota bacterium]|nr:MAG: YbhB/YbcL family Raf kinase inhibitor-like protein [Acidobacteriota bacterium]